MKNYVQPGDVVTVTAPAAVVAGAGVLIGSLFGIAVNSAASAADLELAVTGVVNATKVGSQAWTEGQLIYWSGTALTNVASTNKLVGCAVKPVPGAGAGETTGRVRLNGAAITA